MRYILLDTRTNTVLATSIMATGTAAYLNAMFRDQGRVYLAWITRWRDG